MISQSVDKQGGTEKDPPMDQQVGGKATGPQAAAGQSPADGESEEEAISQGVVFDILRNERRRRVLDYLNEQEGSTTLGDVSERLAAIENDKPESQITSQERKRLYVGLYQCHLPRMDDAGAIDFNSDRGSIEATEDMPSFLEPLDEGDNQNQQDRRWPLYYLAVGVLATGLFTLNITSAAAAQVLPGTAVLLTGVITAVGLGSILHWAATTRATESESNQN